LGELYAGGASVTAELAASLSYVKMGLAGCARISDWPARWRAALSRLAAGAPSVAAAYADYSTASAPAPEEVLRYGSALGCRALLIDTYEKARGGLFDYLSTGELARLIELARANELVIAMAGSLTAESLPMALSFAPDYVAVRGAVCRPARCGTVDRQLVRDLADLVGRRRQ
jgi:uncharacterized protein (UPF0264 family)